MGHRFSLRSLTGRLARAAADASISPAAGQPGGGPGQSQVNLRGPRWGRLPSSRCPPGGGGGRALRSGPPRRGAAHPAGERRPRSHGDERRSAPVGQADRLAQQIQGQLVGRREAHDRRGGPQQADLPSPVGPLAVQAARRRRDPGRERGDERVAAGDDHRGDDGRAQVEADDEPPMARAATIATRSTSKPRNTRRSTRTMTKPSPTPTLSAKAKKPRSIGRLSAKRTAAPQAMPPTASATARTTLSRVSSGDRGACSRSAWPSGAAGGGDGGRRNIRGIVAHRAAWRRGPVYARGTGSPGTRGGVAQRLEQASYTRHVGGSNPPSPTTSPGRALEPIDSTTSAPRAVGLPRSRTPTRDVRDPDSPTRPAGAA